jgi:predicted SAM-dependent methyltransferase
MTNISSTELGALDEYLATLQSDQLSYGLARAIRGLREEVLLSGYFQMGQTALTAGASLDATRLQIGGGAHVLAGWLNLDIVPPADLLWDIRESLPFDDGVTEKIFSEHCLEHLDYPRSAKRHVSEMFRVLAPGGQAIVGVPDANKVIRAYVDGDMAVLNHYTETWYAHRTCHGDFNSPIDWVNYVLRDQEDDSVYHPHFWGYDLAKLVSLFTMAGFSSVKEWEFDPALANQKRQWGSIYVVATK